ncbi:ornithine cyclodeaminase family protein [Noviherbaspirillum saxi]|uniref:Ornithine cyclodeaminase family protein n=1 Tax=Noviherbaspirillum saxi TaxID=2320863 RepID=A0A3A3FQP4_9BURK|nr:ornithine cyclodeaminase family protein [Noviherbaspirillum saxi]RJF95782.1 ornithine cyclodeaminase family protein [Noviherbaspirillum saxi]
MSDNPETSTKQISPVFVTDDAVTAVADWRAAVAVLRDAYSRPMAPEMVPPRTMARGQGFWLRGLCAISPSGEYMGCKLIAASPKIHRASYLISLFDQRTMDLAALVDGNRVTGIRTAATSAVAVDLLAPQRPLRIAIIGSGFEAKGLLEAVLSIREVAEARVFSPTPASRTRFADSFRQQAGLNITAADSAEQAVRNADVVLCAARSRDETPVMRGEWLSQGATVVSIGSTLPEQREVDETTLGRAHRIVADMPEEVAHDTGDALAAKAAGIDVEGKMVSLADVASGRVQGRTFDSEIVIYKSVGSALQDVVIAEMLLKRASQERLTTAMPATVLTIDK